MSESFSVFNSPPGLLKTVRCGPLIPPSREASVRILGSGPGTGQPPWRFRLPTVGTWASYSTPLGLTRPHLQNEDHDGIYPAVIVRMKQGNVWPCA